MKKEHQDRYEAAVRAYHEQGREVGLAMKQSLRDEVGDEEMENLSAWYEGEWEAQIETVEGLRERELYQ